MYDVPWIGLYGFNTEEEKQAFVEARRQEREAKKNGVLKSATAAFASSAGQFAAMNNQAKLQAAHRVAAQHQFDESHDQVISTKRYSIDYVRKDGRAEREPDFGY